jgi:hypothetical protein
MDPQKLVEHQEAPRTTMDDVCDQYKWSKDYRQGNLEPRWARDEKIMKGIPLFDKTTVDKITGRPKIYFRKVWSSAWRLMANFHQSFLQDKNRFKISGRDEKNDYVAAKRLEMMTKYRFERMLRRNDAFVKFMWAFMNCISPGTSVVKWFWRYNEETGVDEPDFTVYPLEQVCLDWGGLLRSEMEFIWFENYVTKNQLEEMGYDNIPNVFTDVPQSALRQVRYASSGDPMHSSTSDGQNYSSQGAVGANFPSGTQGTGDRQHSINDRILCVEGYYRKKGKWAFCAFYPQTKKWARKPEPNPCEDLVPVVLGSMLLEPHKLVPESIVESLEGPQEALNLDINLRQTNIQLAMCGGFLYGRFGGVDKQALRSPKPGWNVAANDVSQVVPLKIPDVTQNSFMEANQKMQMLEELCGVNDTVLGMSKTGKTGEAQINFANAQGKIDLFTAIVGQTFFHQSIYILAYMISKFETDEKFFRVVNEKLRDQGVMQDGAKDEYNVDIDMDLEIDVGMSEVSRGIQSQRKLQAFQALTQANQATAMMLKSGIQPKKEITVFDLSEIAAELLPEFGLKNLDKYKYAVIPPPQPQPGAGGAGAPSGGAAGQAVEGAAAPQPNADAGGGDQGFQDFMAQAMGGAQQ